MEEFLVKVRLLIVQILIDVLRNVVLEVLEEILISEDIEKAVDNLSPIQRIIAEQILESLYNINLDEFAE